MAKRGPKRNKAERERDRADISTLYLRGWTQWEITAEINRRYYDHADDKSPITRTTIEYDIKIITERWLKSQLFPFNKAKARELARIDKLEREYWEQYFMSMREKKKTRTSVRALPNENGEGSTPQSIEKVEDIETRTGNPQYLSGIQWCIEQRCRILGVYEAAKIKVGGMKDEPMVVKHGIEQDEAETIFGILETAGAFQSYTIATSAN